MSLSWCGLKQSSVEIHNQEKFTRVLGPELEGTGVKLGKRIRSEKQLGSTRLTELGASRHDRVWTIQRAGYIENFKVERVKRAPFSYCFGYLIKAAWALRLGRAGVFRWSDRYGDAGSTSLEDCIFPAIFTSAIFSMVACSGFVLKHEPSAPAKPRKLNLP